MRKTMPWSDADRLQRARICAARRAEEDIRAKMEMDEEEDPLANGLGRSGPEGEGPLMTTELPPMEPIPGVSE